MKYYLVFGAIAFVTVALAFAKPRDDSNAYVNHVVDGDTIEVNYNERVRLAGIQTPERGHKDYDKATLQLARLVLRKQVKLVRFPEKTYGRTVGVVYVDGKSVNAAMRKKYKSRKYDRLLTEEQRKELKRGGWK